MPADRAQPADGQPPSREDFETLFAQALDAAVEAAESKSGTRLPCDRVIELHGWGREKELLTPAQAARLLFIDEATYYVVIDVGVKRRTKSETVLFVRPAGFPPGPWAKTWGASTGWGPFKVLEPMAGPL